MRKKFFLLPLIVALMFAAADITKAETVSITFKGKPVDLSGSFVNVDGTTFMANKTSKSLAVMLATDDDTQVINVPEGKSLFTYNGDEYTNIRIAVPQNLTVNCSNSKMFQITGRSETHLNVTFIKNELMATGDVTLTLNHESDETGYTRPLFDLSYVNLALNADDAKDKVNINFSNMADNGLIFFAYKPSSVRFGKGDYQMVSMYENTVYNFFDEGGYGNMTVSGLASLDSYAGNYYYSEPFGAHITGLALTDCDDNQIMGEVALKYLPDNWQYFGPENYASWSIVQSCTNGVTLRLTGAGDMSDTEVPWDEYKNIINTVEIQSDVMIPLTVLPKKAFAQMPNLKTVRFLYTTGITEIPDSLFYKCTGLEKVEFSGCEAMDLKKIGSCAFANTALQTFAIPATVEEIGTSAFEECQKADITLPAALKKIGRSAFLNSNILRLPKAVGKVETFDANDAYNAGVFSGPNASLYYEGTLNDWLTGDFEWIMATLHVKGRAHLFIDGKEIVDLVIPEGITELKNAAFCACKGLKSVSFPTSLTKIGSHAFLRCSGLENIILPDNITEVGEESFSGCENVSTLQLSKGMSFINNGSFDGLAITELTVPEGVNAINSFAFNDCEQLKEVTLPRTLENVFSLAFTGCTSLAKVTSYAWAPDAQDNSWPDNDMPLIVWKTAQKNYEDNADWADRFTFGEPMLDGYVSVDANNNALGYVTLDVKDEDKTGDETPFRYSVVNGASFKATATPETNCTFVRWDNAKGEAVSYDMEYSGITDFENGNYQLTAIFEKDSFDVNVTVTGIDPSEVVINGAGRFGMGDNTTLTFTLNNDNYTFEMWLFDENNFRMSNSLTFENIDANHNVEIVFKAKKYMVSATVIPAEAGVVKGQGEYDYGTNYTLTLEPDEKYELKEWRDGIALDEKSNVLSGLVIGEIHIEVIMQLKSATALDDMQTGDVPCTKVFRDGELYILRDGKLYNAAGQQVQ